MSADQPEAPDESQDQPTDDQAPETPETPDQPEAQDEDSFESFDLGGIPEDADREWFENRVKAFQSDYTRKTQAAAEARKQATTIIEAVRDPNHPQHADVMDYLGLEEATDDDDDLYDDEDDDDPTSELERRLAAIEAERQQERQLTAAQRAEAELEDTLAERIDSLSLREGIEEFTEDELRLLVNAAVANPDDEGLPDIDGAYEALKSAYGARQKAWLKSKQGGPRPVRPGVPGSRELDISDRSERIAAAEVAAERAMAD